MEIILNLLKPEGGFRTGKENFMEFESQGMLLVFTLRNNLVLIQASQEICNITEP
jgi:hypothetical protein